MADYGHLDILCRGVEEWNQWRKQNPEITPDLAGADLSGIDFTGGNPKSTVGCNLIQANLRRANLRGSVLTGAGLMEVDAVGADFSNADLSRAFCFRARLSKAILHETDLYAADLSEADLSGTSALHSDMELADLSEAMLTRAELDDANLSGADLSLASLIEASLRRAKLIRANLASTNLSKADLTECDLSGATLVQTVLNESILSGARVYGISVWDPVGDPKDQTRLVITAKGRSPVEVDDLSVAQFIYLLLDNTKIRNVIDTVGKKGVLILGRFTEDRKAVLDELRSQLRKLDYVPMLFDFEKPAHRDLTETVSTLAHLARFVIADITDAKSIPQELKAIVPNLPSVPVQPIILESQYEYEMFKDFGGFLSVLPPYRYRNKACLLASLEERVITPAIRRAEAIEERRKEFEQQLTQGKV
jgi:uncharacterized protein YjbI with pentapeptide repeats